MRAFCVAAGIAMLSIGCGGAASTALTSYVAEQEQQAAQNADRQISLGIDQAIDDLKSPEEPDVGVPIEENRPRQVIHRTKLSLSVTAFGDIDDQISQLTAKHTGYITKATVNRTLGETRVGRWDVRVPVRNYRVFVTDICALGVPILRNETADDVTEQYVDLAARIENEEAIERRIRELLAESTPTSKQLDEFERRLAKSRQTIEGLQGQINVLGNKAAFAYVSIDAKEQLDFTPVTKPTETARISVAWSNALNNIKTAATDLLILVLQAMPWAIVLLPIAIALWVIGRIMARRIRRTPRTTQVSA